MGERKTLPEMDRRTFVSGLAAGAGLGLGAEALAGSHSAPLHLEEPADRLMAFVKLQADLSGTDVMTGMPGEVWAWVPGEGNFHLFDIYSIGINRAEPGGSTWRLFHRDMLVYMDPASGQVLDEWSNPLTGRTVQARHVFTDPMERRLGVADGSFSYELADDDLVFTSRTFEFFPSAVSRADNPLQVQNDKHQSGDIRDYKGRFSEVRDPGVSSAQCVSSWTRMAQWAHFMEMGNRPGMLIYHGQGHKLAEGVSQLPGNVGEFVSSNRPECLELPRV